MISVCNVAIRQDTIVCVSRPQNCHRQYEILPHVIFPLASSIPVEKIKAAETLSESKTARVKQLQWTNAFAYMHLAPNSVRH